MFSINIHKLLHKVKGKSLLQLICIAVSRTVDFLTLVRYRLQYPRVEFGLGVKIRGKLSIKGKGKVTIGNYCSFVNHSQLPNYLITLDSSAHITIGDYCSFNGTAIYAMSSVEFKRQCLIGESRIIDTDFHSVEINRWDSNVKARTKPIYIDENVWIGGQTVILKGVSIGKNSVIGLGAIVRQSVPANMVVIGNPQQIIKELDTTVLPYELG